MTMLGKLDCLAIWSENPNKLAKWYQDTFELEESLRLNESDDTGIGFDINGLLLWFGYHSEIKGNNKDPIRHILEFKVENLEQINSALKKANAKIIRELSYAPSINSDVITAQDPEGNTIQFYKERTT
ncbi:MAG TPA: VOC family protein [Candidatus Saccharimonadales bacterium]|nr:VOC family protein [Candidatus Saccharimonadales bacterium]